MLNYTLENFRKNSEGLYEIYDRFSFDNFFRLLLSEGFDYEEALNFVLCSCSLSTIIFQERIYNKYYLNISTEKTISNDLIDLKNQYVIEIVADKEGLTKQNRVGRVAAWIRECSPKEISDWENFYFQKLKDFLKRKGIHLQPKEYLESLGKTLYTKITEALRSEIDEVTEEDCMKYIRDLVLKRTFDGYMTGKFMTVKYRKPVSHRLVFLT